MTGLAQTTQEADDEIAQAIEQREFGFWLYLMSDAIIFGLLFATYAVLSRGSVAGADGRELFNLTRVAGQTALLLSRLSMAWGHLRPRCELRRPRTV
jgi:cytochrome o ubiquinol oxidase subunit 3